MMFKCNIGVLPLPVSAFFQYNSVIHTHNTRRSKFIHTPIFLRRRIILYRKKQIDKKNTYILCKIYIHIQSILNT